MKERHKALTNIKSQVGIAGSQFILRRAFVSTTIISSGVLQARKYATVRINATHAWSTCPCWGWRGRQECHPDFTAHRDFAHKLIWVCRTSFFNAKFVTSFGVDDCVAAVPGHRGLWFGLQQNRHDNLGALLLDGRLLQELRGFAISEKKGGRSLLHAHCVKQCVVWFHKQ